MLYTAPTLAEHLDELAAEHGWTRAEYGTDLVEYQRGDKTLHVFYAGPRQPAKLHFADPTTGSRRSRSFHTYEEIAAYLAGAARIPFMAAAEQRMDGSWSRRYPIYLDVKLSYNRSWRRWIVRRADNGRSLGWLQQASDGDRKGTWEARIDEAAFRGTGPDDKGDILDHVDELRLFNGYRDGDMTKHRAIATGETRDGAINAIFKHLLDHRAPAVGFTYDASHPGVTTWESRYPTRKG
jgi:hypothetical protein